MSTWVQNLHSPMQTEGPLAKACPEQLLWCCHPRFEACAQQQNLSTVAKHFTFAVPCASPFSHAPKLLHANDSHISISSPDGSRALSRLTNPTPSLLRHCHLDVFHTSQIKQARPRELCFPPCPVPCPPKSSPFWVNDSAHLLKLKTHTTPRLFFPSSHPGHQQVRSALL